MRARPDATKQGRTHIAALAILIPPAMAAAAHGPIANEWAMWPLLDTPACDHIAAEGSSREVAHEDRHGSEVVGR
jgi:hypothetical protein